MRLESIDLNLLVVLDALLEERNVTHAGQRVGLSQPATSNALRRLRRMFDDPLLIRRGNAMVLSGRASELHRQLRPALATLGVALEQPGGFDPATASGTIRIGTTDSVMITLAPALLRHLATVAPGVVVEFQPIGGLDGPKRLRDDLVDLLIGLYRRLSPQLRRCPLFTDEVACIVRRGHPALRDAPSTHDALPLETYLRHDHLRVAPAPDQPGSVADALLRLGRTRRVVCQVPNFLAAPFIVAESDLIATFSRSVAEHFARILGLGLAVRGIPLDLPRQEFDLVWHPRGDDDEFRRWFRGELLAVTMRERSCGRDLRGYPSATLDPAPARS